MKAIDRHLAGLFAGYLSTEAAVTAGLPAVTACQRIVSNDGVSDMTAQQIVIVPQIDDEVRTPTVTITASISGILSDDLSADDMSEIQEVLHTLLDDKAAFYDYIADLDEEDFRTGYRILHYGRAMLQPVQPEMDERRQTLPVVVRVRVVLSHGPSEDEEE